MNKFLIFLAAALSYSCNQYQADNTSQVDDNKHRCVTVGKYIVDYKNIGKHNAAEVINFPYEYVSLDTDTPINEVAVMNYVNYLRSQATKQIIGEKIQKDNCTLSEEIKKNPDDQLLIRINTKGEIYRINCFLNVNTGFSPNNIVELTKILCSLKFESPSDYDYAHNVCISYKFKEIALE